jgi:hypothetical protein
MDLMAGAEKGEKQAFWVNMTFKLINVFGLFVH